MSGPRCDRLLAGTALAVVLAAPLQLFAQEGGKLAAVPTEASPATQASPETSSVPAAPAKESPAPADAAPATPASPAAATEQTAAPDPLASLDPADRVVAEKIRDLFASKAEKIFASKNERTAVESLLSESKPCARLARQRHRECARQGRDCPA